MASAKQIAWRKKFARMSKAGKFKKKKSEFMSKSNVISDSVMLKATDGGFQIPSGWWRLTKKQKLGFLKKFWTTQ